MSVLEGRDQSEREWEGFQKAMQLCEEELVDQVRSIVDIWLPCRKVVEKALRENKGEGVLSRVLFMENPVPWKEHLNELETNPPDGLEWLAKEETQILYVIFKGNDNSWRIQCVPIHSGSFQNRLSLPFKGLRDEDLNKAAGIEDGVFVHHSGFIAGTKSKESTIKLAILALE